MRVRRYIAAMTNHTTRNSTAAAFQGWLADIHPLRSQPRLPGAPLGLPEAGTFSLVVAKGVSLRLLEGSAWVTFEGDAEDHVLEGSAVFVAPGRGRVAVQALSPVRFELRAARLAA